MLPDGKARIIGLKPVDKNGNASDSHVGMEWGDDTDTSLTNYGKVPTTDNAGSTSTGSNSNGYLPSDAFIGAQSFVDGKAKYIGSTPYIPSPYLGDDKTMNPEYSKELEGNNALSDFNGLSNTQTLVGLGTDYTAANAAWKYKDSANSTVQWYLPAMGELGFIMARFNEINAAIRSVGGVSVAVDNDYYFWSSTEYDTYGIYALNPMDGEMYHDDKDIYYYVRVFGIV